jgi:hypothetical protein
MEHEAPTRLLQMQDDVEIMRKCVLDMIISEINILRG